jgi:hypothetical protein
MKVKELIAELMECDPELDVILSSDEEGNSFKKLYSTDNYPCLSEGYFLEEDAAYFNLDDDESLSEYDDSDLIRVICIWP